jgi:hypothetical protein
MVSHGFTLLFKKIVRAASAYARLPPTSDFGATGGQSTAKTPRRENLKSEICKKANENEKIKPN